MSRWCDAVVDGNVVYIQDQASKQIYSYDVTSDGWSPLPDCVYEESSITIINGWLTTIGGYRSFATYFNELFSLTGEGSDKGWTKKFTSMPTKRSDVTSLCTGTILIVVGGMGEGGRVLSTVEVMDTRTQKWSSAADLPEPMGYASATVCGDQFYMLGGFNRNITYVKSVYTCSVSFLQSCVPSSLEANFERQTLSDKAGVWRQVANLPVVQSTCESFHSRLLAIGGKMDSLDPTIAVYMYNSTTNSWEIFSHMTTGRYQCFTAVLPNHQLVVVGGLTAIGQTSAVEIASICK